MMDSLIILGVGVLATLLTRFLPFFIFNSRMKEPSWLIYLGKVLPYATIGLLVVFVFKDVNLLSTPYGIPELISIGFIIIIHRLFHNSLLSIALGTAIYMILIQTLFIY